MTRVIKVGGRVQGSVGLPAALARAAARPGASVCVVHGGGDEVSALQRQLGLEPRFVGGRRVTSIDDLHVVRMVLSGAINKRLAAALQTLGARAVGVSGEDGMLLTARALSEPTMGRVGGDLTVHPELVLHLMAGGFLPVISPIARDVNARGNGETGLNVNGDDAAAALAVALTAEEMVLVADVPGVLEGGLLVPALDLERLGALIASGVVAGGMAAKLEAAAHALQGGVPLVRIADIDGIADAGAGTRIVLTHSSV